MNIQKAIDVINSIDFADIRFSNGNQLIEAIEARGILAELAKKQIPQKAQIDKDVSMRYEPVRICPACGGKFLGNVAKYCYRCGQAVEYDTED